MQHLLSSSGFQMTNETEGPEFTRNCKRCKQKGSLKYCWRPYKRGSLATVSIFRYTFFSNIFRSTSLADCCLTWSPVDELVFLWVCSFLKSSNLCAKPSSSRIPFAFLAKVPHNPSLGSFMLSKDGNRPHSVPAICRSSASYNIINSSNSLRCVFLG